VVKHPKFNLEYRILIRKVDKSRTIALFVSYAKLELKMALKIEKDFLKTQKHLLKKFPAILMQKNNSLSNY